MIRKKVLLIMEVALATEFIWYVCRWVRSFGKKTWNARITEKVNVCKSKQNISKVMFFSNEASLCRAHVISEEPCLRDSCPVRYLREVESYINRAKRNLDVCMYTLTCQLLLNAIVNAHKRGVLVRIIMDHRMACNQEMQIGLFYNNGVPIRLDDLGVLMHHKFAVVDNDIVITGSVNWTMSGFFGNFEHLLVTNHCVLVQPFVNEFNKLWKIFSESAEKSQHSVQHPVIDTNSQ
ncbi:Mitochondrial cardiolipin hydrolase [Anthophora quadrimaculata]